MLALMTIAGTYYLFQAKVSVEPDAPILKNSAINIPFKITNNSVLPIYPLKSECRILSMGGLDPFNWEMDHMDVLVTKSIPKLRSGETTSIDTYTRFVGGNRLAITHGDIVFTVRFSPSIFWWRQLEEQNRFEARVSEDGETKWYHKSLSE